MNGKEKPAKAWGKKRELVFGGTAFQHCSALQDENAVVKEGNAVFLPSLKRNWWG